MIQPPTRLAPSVEITNGIADDVQSNGEIEWAAIAHDGEMVFEAELVFECTVSAGIKRDVCAAGQDTFEIEWINERPPGSGRSQYLMSDGPVTPETLGFIAGAFLIAGLAGRCFFAGNASVMAVGPYTTAVALAKNQ